MGLLPTTVVLRGCDGGSHAVPYAKTITEKRAPTDDSIRIYDEMMQKVQDNIVSTFKITNSFVTAVVIAFSGAMYSPLDNPALKIWCRFMLNNKQEDIKFELDGFEVAKINRQSNPDQIFINMIHDKLSRLIAKRMIQETDVEELLTARKGYR